MALRTALRTAVCRGLLAGGSRPGRVASVRGLAEEAATSSSAYNCKDLNVTTPAPHVYSVELNRPEKMNALNFGMWEEIGAVFKQLDRDKDCRVVILSAAGRMFSSGIDLGDFTKLASLVYNEDDIARQTCFQLF